MLWADAMPCPGVDAILMASGFSRRFGGANKLLAPFGGTPLALRTLRLACGHGFGRVFFIWSDEEVGRLAGGLPCTSIQNHAPEKGRRESARLGAAATTAEYLLFMPCDQPLLDAATLDTLLAARAPGKIVVPVQDGAHRNPCLFSAAFRPQLLGLAAGGQPRDIIAANPGAVVPVAIASPWALRDADTPEALTELEAQL